MEIPRNEEYLVERALLLSSNYNISINQAIECIKAQAIYELSGSIDFLAKGDVKYQGLAESIVFAARELAKEIADSLFLSAPDNINITINPYVEDH